MTGRGRASVTVDRVFFAAAAALSIYMGISTFVFLQQSPRHYATLVFAIVTLSGLLAARDALAERERGGRRRTTARLLLAGFVVGGGTVSLGYVYAHAQRLQIEQPFLALAASAAVFAWVAAPAALAGPARPAAADPGAVPGADPD
jgi:hypothetical protein